MTAAAAAAALALLAGPSLRDAKPDWISGESLEWPRHKYLSGVGVADERTTAEDRARAELAKVFTARVTGTTSSWAAEQTTISAAGKKNTAGQVAVSDQATSSTDKVLSGVEIAATWQDPASRQVWALAVLDRRRAGAALQAQLAAMDDAARALDARLSDASDPVAAAVAGMRIVALGKRREPLLADLRIIDPRAEAGGEVFGRAKPRADAALGRLVVALAVGGDGAKTVETGVAQGLGAVGMKGRPGLDPQKADLFAEAQTRLEELGKRDGWFWARATTTFVLREVKTGRVLFQVEESARESATLQPEARRRAVKSAADGIAEKIPASLDGWLEES